MIRMEASASVETRLAVLERQVSLWRLASLSTVGLLALAGFVACDRAAPHALEAASVTLVSPGGGGSVTLTLRPSGVLEAKFSRAPGAEPAGSAGSGLVLVDPRGREIVHLGEPIARPLGSP